MHRRISIGRLLALAGAWAVLWAGALEAQETVEVRGTLHTTWIDHGETGVEGRILTLVAEDGRVYLLQGPATQPERLGGTVEPGGRQVTLRVRRSALLDAARDPGGRLTVESIEWVSGRRAFDAAPLSVAPLRATVEPTPMPFVTLLCRYAGATGDPPPASRYEELMSMTFPNTGHFWTEAAGGAFTMEGSQVLGWYTLPRPETEYDVVGSSIHNTSLLLDDCMAAADADVYFPDFGGINVQVDGSVGDYLNLNGYATVGYSERDGTGITYAVTVMSRNADLGTYIHEIGHTLGLPHSSGPYGQTYDSHWDVMSGGRWLAAGNDPTGVRTIAYHLDRLGWIRPEQRLVAPAGETTVLLMPGSGDAAGSDPRLVVIPLPSGEYYTLEARRREGYDAGIPLEGVVMHHVGTGRLEPAHVVDVDGNGDVNDEGAVLGVGEVYRDRGREVEVSVDAEVGRAFRVTVRVAAMDSLHVLPAPHGHEVPFGWTGEIRDSAYVRAAGPNGATIPWTVQGFGLIVDTPSGVGSGWARWRMVVEPMAEGAYPYGLRIEGNSVETGPVEVNPTLLVGPPAELAGAFAGGGGRTWAMADRDVASFMASLPPLRFGGPGAAEARWSVLRKPPWMQLAPDSGTGDGYLMVTRSATGMAAGSYTDTVVIKVEHAAQPAVLLDHFEVVGPVQIVPHWTPAGMTVPQESSPIPDSVYVELIGPRSDQVEVSASGLGPLNVPHTSRTIGSGWIHFARAPGTHLPGDHPVQLRFQTTLDQENAVVVHDTVYVVAAPPTLVVSERVVRDSAFLGEWSEGAVYVEPAGAGAATRPWRPVPAVGSIGRLLILDDVNATMDTPPNSPRPGARWVRWVRDIADRPAGAGEDTIRIAYEDEPRATVVVLDSVWVVRDDPPQWVTITSDSIRPAATMGSAYQDTLRASDWGDGVRWAVVAGAAPGGVVLDSLTGVLSGVPEAAGPHRFTAVARSGEAADTARFRIDVTAPALRADDVLDHLLGGEALPDPLAHYLDLLGNRNGRVDVGDVLAWLVETESVLAGAAGDPDDVAALRDMLSTDTGGPRR